MLIMSETDTIDIVVYFIMDNGNIKFHEESTPDMMSETFTFRRPGWADTVKISACISIDPTTGKSTIDPFKYMDIRLKTLLKDWTLKDSKGKKIPVSPNSINNLAPSLAQYIFEKIENIVGSEKIKLE